jgi:hypothetical protein
MKGWGSVSLSLALGVFMSGGCGGRTDAFYEEGYEPNEQAGNGSGAVVGAAGRPGRAGAGNTGGAGPNPSGGFSSVGGSYVTAGTSSGGTGFGGLGFGGFGFGGTTGVAGSFATGGFPSDSCQTCIFQTCGDTLGQCLQDFGCIAILACAQATGCQAFQCYNPMTCGPIIDDAGGPGGPSMSLLLKSLSCVVTSGCPCN